MYLTELQEAPPQTSNMQVKLFVHNSLEEVEAGLNHWLSAQEIQIRHVVQSQSEKQGRFVFVISVFYTC